MILYVFDILIQRNSEIKKLQKKKYKEKKKMMSWEF